MTAKGTLAIDGGRPVRAAMLPYGRHRVDQADVDAVVTALRSDWLTTGPAVDEFETAFAKAVGARHAVAFVPREGPRSHVDRGLFRRHGLQFPAFRSAV